MSEPERLPEEQAAEKVPLPKPTDPPPEGVKPPPPPKVPPAPALRSGKQGEPVVQSLGEPGPEPTFDLPHFNDSKIAMQFNEVGVPLQHGVPDDPDALLAKVRKPAE